jgi:hypothetical protein
MNESVVQPRTSEVASVRKALEILCAFNRETPSLTVSELSRRLALPKSTTHNLLRTMQALDFLTQDPIDKQFRLGAVPARVGRSTPAKTKRPPGRTRSDPGGHSIRTPRSYFSSISTISTTSILGLSTKVAIRFE